MSGPRPEDLHWPGLVAPHSPEMPEGWNVREAGELPIPAGTALPTIAIPTRAPEDGTTPVPGHTNWTTTPVDTDPAAESPPVTVYPGTGAGAGYRRLVFYSRAPGVLLVFHPGGAVGSDAEPAAAEFNVGPGGRAFLIDSRSVVQFFTLPTGGPAPARINVFAAATECREPYGQDEVLLDGVTVPGGGTDAVDVPPQGAVEVWVGTTGDGTVFIDADGGTVDSFAVVAADPPRNLGPLPARARVGFTAPPGAAVNVRVSFRTRW